VVNKLGDVEVVGEKGELECSVDSFISVGGDVTKWASSLRSKSSPVK
jgi:hypothetical protein